MTVGPIHRLTVGLLEANDINIQEPRGEPPPGGWRQEDIARVQIRVVNALLMELAKKSADRGKNPGPLRGSGSSRKITDKILAAGNKGGDHLDAPKRSGGVKEDRLNPRSGNFHPGQALAGTDFAKGAAGTRVKIPGQTTPPSAMGAGSDHPGSSAVQGRRKDRLPSREAERLWVAANGFAKAEMGTGFFPKREQGVTAVRPEPSVGAGESVGLKSGRRGEGFQGRKMGRISFGAGSWPASIFSSRSEVRAEDFSETRFCR